jgi:predicted AAA+ superfamily ATPase
LHCDSVYYVKSNANIYKKYAMVQRINTIKEVLKKKKSVLVLGPRGSGKTYFVNHLLESFNNKLKIDLLDGALYRRYLNKPEQLSKDIEYQLNNDVLYVFIDEVQTIPQLLNEVHRLIERYKGRCVFILTGSSARRLKRNETNLLAGRALFFPFYPFNSSEIDIEKHFSKILQFGTLPEVFLENDIELIKKYLLTYCYVYLKEEILQESVVRNIEGFSRFLELSAIENGMPVNFSKIAKQVGLSTNTVKGHYQIIEDSFLVTRIPAWTYSIKKQLQQSAKYYFFDNGIVNALTGELSTELRESTFRYGRLFENFVINEIIRYNTINELNYRLYHYRTNHGAEIDLILQKNIRSEPVAVEVKSGSNPGISDVKQFRSLRDDYPNAKCVVLCSTPFPYKDNGILFLPYKNGIKEIFK